MIQIKKCKNILLSLSLYIAIAGLYVIGLVIGDKIPWSPQPFDKVNTWVITIFVLMGCIAVCGILLARKGKMLKESFLVANILIVIGVLIIICLVCQYMLFLAYS